MSKKKPVRYEVVDKDGHVFGPFDSVGLAVDLAKALWPDQEQDADRLK